MEMTVLWISNSWIKKLVVKCSWRKDEEMTQTLIVSREVMTVAMEIVMKKVTNKRDGSGDATDTDFRKAVLG